MFPRATAYRFPGRMTACFSAFRRQLPGGGYGAPSDALGPVSILEELIVQTRRGAINRADAASLEQDVRSALGELGPCTREALGEGLDLFLKIMGRVRPRIEEEAEAEFLRSEVSLLLRCLSRGAVREAAFEDAWRSFRQKDRLAERCELRLLQLREIAEHGAFDWTRLCERLDAILADHRPVIAKLDGGVTSEGGETAGLGEDERLALCREMLGRDPDRSDYVVWLVIDHPALPEPWISLGPVDIFTGGLWPDGLSADSALVGLRPDFIPPAELDDDRGLRPGTERLEPEEVLLARVSLTGVPRGGAADRARRVLESTIALANPESSWQLYEGEMVWNPGGGWSGSSLLSPAESEKLRGPVHAIFEPTAEGLGQLDPGWVERLAGGERASDEAVRDARLGLGTFAHRDPLLTVALGTRPLERMLDAFDPGGEDRAAVARAYLKPAWVKGAVYDELFGAAVGGLEVARPFGGERLRRVEAGLWRSGRPGERLFSLAGFEAVAVDLLAVVDDEGTIADRLLRRAIVLMSDPAAALRQLKILEGRFERLLARSERQRNTTIHGNLPPPALVDGAAGFLADLGSYAARDLFRHDTGEAAAGLPLTREQAAFERALSALSGGDLLVPSLFPEETTTDPVR